METIYLACSAMVLIDVLTMLHQFFFLCGFHSSYKLFENYPSKQGDDYCHYCVCKYVTFYHICYDL